MSDKTAWPALGSEAVRWKLDEAFTMSRTARRRGRGPFQAALAPEIAKQVVGLPSATSALAEEAANAISRFDAELGQDIALFATILLRSESAASSKIENLTASARSISEAEIQATGKANASMVVANQRALTAAIALAERIDSAAILKIHRALLSESNPDIAGRWREEQVWIGGGNASPYGATCRQRSQISWRSSTVKMCSCLHTQQSHTRSSKRSIRSQMETAARAARFYIRTFATSGSFAT